MNKIINNIFESFDIILKENKSSLNEVSSTSSSLFGGSSVKIPSDGLHKGQRRWPSNNAWDIAAAPNTPVYAIASGKVITMNNYGTDLIETEGKRLYGYGFTVDSTDNLPDVYYTHLTTVSVKQGDNIQCGQFLGYVMKSPKSVNYDHVHIGVETGNIRKFLNPNGTLKCGGSITGELSEPVKSTDTSDSDNNNDNNNDNNIETAFIRQLVTPLHGVITKGITEEKVYSKLGNEISSKFGNIIIPSRGNTKIKSPINGVVNNYHSDRHCTNKISIEHSIDDKLYYLQFCNISKPEIRDGKKVSKGDIIGSTSSDVTVSLYDKGLNRLNLPTMLNKEINKKEKSTNVISKTKNKDENNNNNNNYDKKEITYYDPLLPWLGKKIFDVGKKIQDKMPSITKGGEPKTKNFFNKYGMSNKKVDENIERIKTLLK